MALSKLFFQFTDLGLISSLARLLLFSLSSLSLEKPFGLLEFLNLLHVEFLFGYSDDQISRSFLLSLKRLIKALFFILLLLVLSLWNHIGLWCDVLFFPDLSLPEVSQPLFIVGNARSGTTWLHRLIVSYSDKAVNAAASSHDKRRLHFTSFKTWEIMFAVSLSWKWLFYTIYRVDEEVFYSILFRSLLALESILLGNISTIYTLRSHRIYRRVLSIYPPIYLYLYIIPL